ncbi:hypothetical protein PIB30_048634 [Stylosanthes scabra]|uniref:Uncharacterized protein n=1 Tax=Stylosanthes scabra TaxID=79078 RepID=A0ABU6VH74_9FABA|nr:hypothetical protein [Stylosanthes scabra]
MMFNLNELPGSSNEGFNYGVDSEPQQGMLPEEFESHEGSAAGDPMTEPFHLDPDQDDGGDEVEEELNSFIISQVSLAQPAISQPYEYPEHFSTLNLNAMNSDVWWGQGALTMIRRLNLRKVWLAKQRVIAKIYGDWEESYNELPRWLFAM